MTSTLKLRSKAICLKMLSQRVVFPAAEPPAALFGKALLSAIHEIHAFRYNGSILPVCGLY